MTIWLCVTHDKYELPVAVADSGQELAEICGVARNTVYSSIRNNRIKNGGFSRYIRVEVDDDDDE